MQKMIIEMRKELFNYNITGFIEKVIEIFELLQSKLDGSNDLELQMFVECNSLIQEALNKGDYLFVADVFKQKLCPIFEKKEH